MSTDILTGHIEETMRQAREYARLLDTTNDPIVDETPLSEWSYGTTADTIVLAGGGPNIILTLRGDTVVLEAALGAAADTRIAPELTRVFHHLIAHLT